MDIKAKFIEIERLVTEKKYFNRESNQKMWEEDEIVNWRELFKVDQNWIKESLQSTFDKNFKNRRRQVVFDGFGEQDTAMLFQLHKVILGIIPKSKQFINSHPSKTILFLENKPSCSFMFYKQIPRHFQEDAWERVERSLGQLTKHLKENEIAHRIFKTSKEKSIDRKYVLMGIQISLNDMSLNMNNNTDKTQSTRNEQPVTI
jgi:hypothetical protein